MKKIFNLVLIALFAVRLSAQVPLDPRVKHETVMLNVADSCYKISNFYGAHQAYKQILNESKKPDAAIAYKCAESCRLYQNYKEAENYYKLTISLDSINYPIAGYWYAEMLKFQGKYASAAKAFGDYYNKNKNSRDYPTRKAKHEIVICRDSADKIGIDNDVTLNRIDNYKINSRYSEYGPCQYADTVLYFSGIRPADTKLADSAYDFHNYFTKIYKSVYSDSTWSDVKEVSGVNASNSHTANLTFGYNQEEVFFSRCELKERVYCNLYRADFSNGRIKNATMMPSPINRKGSNTTNPRFIVAGDEQYLFFSSDRPGGSGMNDIWYSKRNPETGAYEAPRNCGKNVNTFGNEVTPFYDHRDSTLFFSSELHNSMGGYDVFASKGDLSKNVWSKVRNVGKPINSTYNDMYYHYAEDSTTAYLVSNRDESTRLIDEAHSNDIYYYKMVRRSIERISELVPLQLYFDNDQPNPSSLDTTTTAVYEDLFLAYMDRRDEYIKQNRKGLPSEVQDYYERVVNELFDNEIEKGWIKLSLFAELMEVIMSDGYDIIITFKGYSSPLGNTVYNENIAKRRIACVQNFFDDFKGGVFDQYLENEPETGQGSLSYMHVPIGETVAENTFMKNGEVVNADDLESRKNLKKSIYSPAAALQRKIEILAVEIAEKEALEEELNDEIKTTKKEITEEEAAQYGLNKKDETNASEENSEDESVDWEQEQDDDMIEESIDADQVEESEN